MTNLACLTQYISQRMDEGLQVDVIYLDFAKAFDKLDHGVCLSKLGSFGLSDQLLSLLESYLCDRFQYVCHKGFASREYATPSGIPQGSNLGPLVFICSVNDAPLALTPECNILLYADDAKLYLTINKMEDAECLQANLNQFYSWCQINKLQLNLSKCKVVSFTRRKQSVDYPYSCDLSILSRETVTKDLGVIFDNKLLFDQHIKMTVAKALTSLGFIIRNSHLFQDLSTLVTLFRVLVLSRLEYACVIWNPYYHCYSSLLESVQRRFLKYLYFRTQGSYPPFDISNTQLQILFHMPPLAIRRQILLLMFLYKLINNGVVCPDLLLDVALHVPRLNSRSKLTFHIDTPRTNLLCRSPLFMMCNLYNSLCQEYDIFHLGLVEFKRSVTAKLVEN